MQLYRFAFVSNSPEIGASVASCADPSTEQVLLSYATMEKAVPVARQLLADGVDAIIGGGGTAALLAERIGASVVNVTQSPLDLLQALLRARRKAKSVAVTSYAKPLPGADFYERILGMRLLPVAFSSSDELEAGIELALSRGARLVVGGGVCCEMARSRRADAVVVVPRRENVMQALGHAREIARARRDGGSPQACDDAPALLLLDECGRVGIISDAARSMLRTILPDTQAEDLIGHVLPPPLRPDAIMAALTSRKRQEHYLSRRDGGDCLVSVKPLLVEGMIAGAALTLRGSVARRTKGQSAERHRGDGFVAKHSFESIRGIGIAALVKRATRYAASDASILIEGETGTGKELFAQSIHNSSPRRDGPFVAVNCAALPESLLESEMFGYEEGAFTGARRGGKRGLFDLASDGTLFLDEIADIPPSVQVRILRVLEEKVVLPVGGTRLVHTNVRVISAAQCDLFGLTQARRFRTDLYFRLSTLRLRLPPLRDRIEDISNLLESLLEKHGIDAPGWSPDLRKAMAQYAWPGNIRELDGVVQTYAALCQSRRFSEALFLEILADIRLARTTSASGPSSAQGNLKQQLRDQEQTIIQRALSESGYNRRAAARLLGISSNSLWRKCRRKTPD